MLNTAGTDEAGNEFKAEEESTKKIRRSLSKSE